MDSFKALTKLYDRWLLRNKFNPLISADDLLYDHHCGNVHYQTFKKDVLESL